ncbi:universal stress protein [Brevibacterium sandarakinum]|uniref:universal stress protein n=1 Tax=Brevibacterium sandarakinum TaxID=629680 RepID=UPI00350E5431
MRESTWTLRLSRSQTQPRAARYADHLNDVATQVSQRHTGPVLRPHLQEGSAATVLPEATRTAAPVTLGNRGRGGLTSLLLGSVRRGWLNQMTAPALIVPRMTAQSALCAPVAIRRVRHLPGVPHSPKLYIM